MVEKTFALVSLAALIRGLESLGKLMVILAFHESLRFTVRSPPFDAMPPTAVFPDAILGVSLFADIAPDQFGRFNRAFATLFRIAAGDTWIDSLPILGPDGSIQWKPALYTCTFIVVSVWVVLQVTCDA